MESRARIAIKALTWQLLGLVVMLGIGLAFTGSLSAGGGIALVSGVTGYLCYFLHEMAWARIGWGRRPR
ncbi:DUF2061 domain-containing protein [Paracoccus zeaxanthinifaciens]|uniref:DUF2061 domain-containing protein n=1 Tax=Paracoccus zeaxanthinifaciens TaxID=187400 RepID=UPI0003B58DE0|nr:DUF2061 domain-containing protein [Paracoccus zeaxanthinifaciens]